ncbi:MAG: hypothetical protein IPG90_02915 [Bacteroidetes bacterium]|nr:hypothetical protein [Bacteroidota bacterium]MBK6837343.1 hypothetical protein [Bacteroidota bacterium]MBK9523247.1 hypothetical protein [Bacteroidota bacterium]MBK9540991.1 hypothetical protein [Bacteroidota bacterium]
MFQRISAHNNEWNRKYLFSEENGKGFFMDAKNGLAYFAWIFPDEKVEYYKCEQGVFEKSFALTDEQIEFEFDPYDSLRFHRYPMD